jgi:hypothetical protein
MNTFVCQDCESKTKKPKTKSKKPTSAPIPKQQPSNNPEQSKKRPLPSLSPVVNKKPRQDSAAATGATHPTAVSSRANIPTVSMPDALFHTPIPPSPTAGHSQTIVNLTSSIKLFAHRDANLGMQLVKKVRQQFKNPPGPEAFLEVLPSKGKIFLF